MARISAVLFDFDHTLGIDHHLEADVLAALGAQACARPPNEQQVVAALARFRSGSVSLDGMIVEAFRAWGCNAVQVSQMPQRFRERALAEAPKRVSAFPGVHEMLAQLEAHKLPFGILTNGWTELQVLKAQLIGFPGPVLVSESIGAWKPDPRAFEIGVRLLHLDQRSTLYAGDEPAVDVAGAKAAGLLCAWADLESKPYPAEIVQPDFTVNDWRQFYRLIEAQELRGA